MKEKEKFLPISESLRKRAEVLIENRVQFLGEAYSESDFLKLIHELEVYKLELELQYKESKSAAELENELLKLSVELNSMKSSEFSSKIDLALSHIGHFLSTDRAHIFEINEENNTISNTYEWCRPGIQSEIHNQKNIRFDAAPKLMNAMETEDYIYIPDVHSLPLEWGVEREVMASKNIRSLLAIPFRIDNKIAGVVGLDTLYKRRDFSTSEIETLKTWSNLLAGVLSNKRRESEVEKTHRNYESIFNIINDFLVVLNEKGEIVHTNAKITEKLGYTVDMLLGKTPVVLHPPERKAEVEEILQELLQGKVDTCLIPFISKLGIQIPVETRVRSGIWEGKPAFFGIIKDISQLKLSEEKFSKIFYLNPSPCGLTDLETKKIVDVNKAFSDLLGFSKEEVIGKNVLELGIMADTSRIELLQNLSTAERIVDKECVFFTKQGETKIVVLSAEVIAVQNKQYLYFVAHDITDRKLVENELYIQNQKINAILSASPDGIGILSFEGNIKFISDHLAKMNGYSVKEKDEFLGKSISSFIAPTDYKKLAINMKKLMEGKKLQNITEYEAIKKDGSHFTIAVNSTILNDYNGSPQNILFVERDVTELKKTEEALRKSEAQFRAVVQTIPDLIWLKDPNGVYLSCNGVFANFFGLVTEKLIGKTDYEIITREIADIFSSQDKKVIKEGKTIHYEENLPFEGQIKNFETTKAPVYDESGELMGVLGIAHDITKRKQAEKVLIENEKRLNELNASKDKFLSILGHDLKSPLATINGFSSLLQDQIAENNQKGTEFYADIIHEASQKAIDLVDDLMQWSRSQSGKMACDPEILEVDELITSVIQLLQPVASKKNINICTDYNHLALVSTDRYMVETILRNLISNAIKFSNSGGEIVIKTFQDEENLTVSVIDNGIGIAQEKLEKMFRIEESFTTPGTSNEKGTGLGLLLCKEFLTILKGEIWVESEENKGSVFHFSIHGKI